MYQNIGQGDALGLGNIGNFVNATGDNTPYWSSSADLGQKVNAWAQEFSENSTVNTTGAQFEELKNELRSVRAVRTEVITTWVYGCTSIASPNYDPTATVDDGSCIVIGDTYQGGIIFYLDGNGGGKIVHDTALAAAKWGCGGNNLGTSDNTGTGAANTNLIINASCNQSTDAANTTQGTISGYNDWYMPSKGDLFDLYTSLGTTAVTNFGANAYLSSSEYVGSPTNMAYYYHSQTFPAVNTLSKSNSNLGTLAIRDF